MEIILGKIIILDINLAWLIHNYESVVVGIYESLKTFQQFFLQNEL